MRSIAASAPAPKAGALPGCATSRGSQSSPVVSRSGRADPACGCAPARQTPAPRLRDGDPRLDALRGQRHGLEGDPGGGALVVTARAGALDRRARRLRAHPRAHEPRRAQAARPRGAAARPLRRRRPRLRPVALGAQALFHNWWSAPRTWAEVERIDLDSSHASWLENLPWTRLDGVELPGERKPMIDRARLQAEDPPGVRQLLGDGSYGGLGWR
jgi:hypothetical protein